MSKSLGLSFLLVALLASSGGVVLNREAVARADGGLDAALQAAEQVAARDPWQARQMLQRRVETSSTRAPSPAEALRLAEALGRHEARAIVQGQPEALVHAMRGANLDHVKVWAR